MGEMSLSYRPRAMRPADQQCCPASNFLASVLRDWRLVSALLHLRGPATGLPTNEMTPPCRGPAGGAFFFDRFRTGVFSATRGMKLERSSSTLQMY